MRRIIHIDADCFYASVELRENPDLAGRPVAVGGAAERRGVVATCNYEARHFGVHSAMSTARALQLCPQLTLIKPNFELYRAVSADLREIFHEYTDLVEPLSLDEAYLDVTGCHQHRGSGTLIAEAIRETVRKRLRITVSAGVAPNKFLAKVASDWNKPDGCFTIAPAEVDDFVAGLPVSRIMGVGRVTAARLKKLGVVTCGDLQALPVEDLARRFGKYGLRLADLARGVDDRPVKTGRVRKSISVEHTYPRDMAGEGEILGALPDLLEELSRRFERIAADYCATKRYIKIKFADFRQTTMEEGIPGNGEPWLNRDAYQRLLSAAWQRQCDPVRLLGVGLRLEPAAAGDPAQLDWVTD